MARHEPAALPNRRPRLLVVDDHTTNRRVVSRILASRGYEVLQAASGTEAIAVARRERLDLILMDIQMPVMDGLEATRQIREQATVARRFVPVVAVTAHVVGDALQRCLRAGMSAVLAKPFHAEELYDIVERHLLQNDAEQTPPPHQTRCA